jgi:N-acetylmuramoyl-L-alanine amidase
MLRKWISLSITLLVAAVFLASLPSVSLAAKPKDQTEFEKAVGAFEKLKNDSRKRRYRDQWDRILAGFDTFIRKNGSSEYIDDAEYNRAAALLEVYRVTRIYADLLSAENAYSDFILEYPNSPYMDEALYESGRIYIALGRKEDAAKCFFMVANHHQASPHAPESRERLASLPKVEIEVKGPESIKGLHQVTDIRYWSHQATTRVVIELEEDFSFEDHLIKQPDRLYFDIRKAFINSPLKDAPIDVQNGMLTQIRTSQYDSETVRVVLDIDNISDYNATKLPDPPRLVIDVTGGGAMASGYAPVAIAKTDKPVVPANKPEPKTDTKPDDGKPISLARQMGLCVSTIVIDPGHGGKDSGAVGRSGLMEKDVALDIGLRLRKLLNERLGCKVLMTRDNDTFIELDERPYIARRNKADIFLSIHVNASNNKSARGIETYLLNTTKKRGVMEVAARENMSTSQKMSDLVDIVTDILTLNTLDESVKLAEKVQTNIVNKLSKKYSGIRERNVKQGPFLVLYGTKCASVLTEVGFISNSDEEKLLKSPQYRQEVAEAIYDGINLYISDLKVAYSAPLN